MNFNRKEIKTRIKEFGFAELPLNKLKSLDLHILEFEFKTKRTRTHLLLELRDK